MIVPVDLPVATAFLVAAVGRLLLHGGHPHGTESANTVGIEYVAASVVFVGVVGGLLYWFFGRMEMG